MREELYKFKRKFQKALQERRKLSDARKRPKIFGIGCNKTGTTSLKRAMNEFGYIVGNQKEAEMLFDDWVKRDFRRIGSYCNTAEFFQDIPFSLPHTFIAMDQLFPGSKFILTVRDSSDQWYQSLIRFHGKRFANGKVPPDIDDLKKAFYINHDYVYYSWKHVYKCEETDPYNREILIEFYENHNQNVLDYFRHRSSDLLVLNVSEKSAYKRLGAFLGKETLADDFPWANKT